MTVKADAAEFLLELAELNGVACGTVSDGHVLVFKRSKLQEILASTADQETVVVFVKRTDMQG